MLVYSDPLLETAKLKKLNDNDMVNCLRSNLINLFTNPSVETLYMLIYCLNL